MCIPDQVLRHFELTQYIPDVVDQLAQNNRVSKCWCDWGQELSAYISRWDDRANKL